MIHSTHRGLFVCLSAIALASCQDYDGGFSEIKIKEVEYTQNFEKAFGKIDPTQDFNLATRATANVNLDEVAQVKIYTLNPLVNGAKLIADLPADKVSSFKIDLIEGTSEVFVQAVSKRGAIINGYYPVVDGVLNINSDEVETRASGTCNTTVGASKTLNVYYSGASWNNSIVTKHYTLYSLEDVSSSRSTPWRLGDFRKVLHVYKDANGDEQDGVFKEEKNNWRDWVKTGKLANDVKFTMASDGPVSVTLNYRQTSTYTNQLCYFYYTGNDYPTPENVKLYSLIPDATGNNDLVRQSSNNGTSYTAVTGSGNIWGGADNTLVQGTTFDLVYFGADGNSSGTFTFPKDVHIGFAVVQDNNGDGTEIHNNHTDKVWFSIQDMNIPSGNWWLGDPYENQNFPAAATFKIGDVTFLGFEDWPDSPTDDGGSDLNDLLFFAVGDFQEDIPDIDPEPDPEPEAQDWMLVYEDLGNSFDWDYNDVVLKVAHATGTNKLTITPMAAGGTLASYVKFNGSNVGAGEIHQLLGASAAASGSYSPINASSRNDGTPVEITLTDAQDASFSMTTLGAADAQGGITLHVVPEGNEGEEGIESSTVIAYSLDNTGTAPEVICLPASWNYTTTSGATVKRTFCWPAELQHIDDAYSGFAAWVGNKSSNTEWYMADPNPAYCASGNFEVEVSEPSTGNESSSEESGEIPSTPTETTLIIDTENVFTVTFDQLTSKDKSLFTSTNRIDIQFVLKEESETKVYLKESSYYNVLNKEYNPVVFTTTTTYSITDAEMLNHMMASGVENDWNSTNVENISSIIITNYKSR